MSRLTKFDRAVVLAFYGGRMSLSRKQIANAMGRDHRSPWFRFQLWRSVRRGHITKDTRHIAYIGKRTRYFPNNKSYGRAVLDAD